MRRLGGWLPVSALLDLMADLDVEPQLVRAAITRMKSSGLLVSSRRDRRAGYALTARATKILEEGDRRILTAREPANLSEGWVLVIFSVPESHRHHRHQLRKHLVWLGFGTIAAGAWIAPRRLRAELETNLERAHLLEYTERFDVAYEGREAARRLVDRCWDLPDLGRMYSQFAARWQPVLHRCHDASPRDAFRDYVNVVADWRRLPFLDPGLPTEILPDGWEGEDAKQIYFALLARIDCLALAHVEATARLVSS